MTKALKGLIAEGEIALALSRGLEAVRDVAVPCIEVDDAKAKRGWSFEDRIERRVERKPAIAEPSPGNLHRTEFGRNPQLARM
ncbi:hypothetical protein [Bradyrhizobium sp. URHA0013]|uniref:hypothetical protein n=1 Tax=Bradyrhizobium sp. URHA0013 TaxID=1380352 RepID=UPI001FDAAC34|nr:hypothetical protein [Bradyrhizobium sp. URHA0013]